MKKHTQSFSAVALGIGSLLLAASAQAMDFGNMMNPSKWMGGGNNDRNSHYGGGPGYGGPVYGYGGGPGGYGGGPCQFARPWSHSDCRLLEPVHLQVKGATSFAG